MKTKKQITTGFVITVVIFIISTFLGGKLNLKNWIYKLIFKEC